MKLRVNALTLHFEGGQRTLEFGERLTYMHGPVGVGKTSTLDLINYALGADITPTGAMKAGHLESVDIEGVIGDHEFVAERSLRSGKSFVELTWRDENGNGAAVRVPVSQPGADPIWKDETRELYVLGDLLYYLLGIKPPFVPKNATDEGAKRIRLSFRDLFWFCYLKQATIDSNFFHLYDPILQSKARHALRFMTGYLTDNLLDIEYQLDENKESVRALRRLLDETRRFLSDFGSTDSEAIEARIVELESEQAQLRVQQGRGEGTRPSLPTELVKDHERILAKAVKLAAERTEVESHLARLNRLRHQMISYKFRLSRVKEILNVMPDARFIMCPECGQKIEDAPGETTCHLCSRPYPKKGEFDASHRLAQKDVTARIRDLSQSIQRLEAGLDDLIASQEQVEQQQRRLQQRIDEMSQPDESDIIATREAAFRLGEIASEIGGAKKQLGRLERLDEYQAEIGRLEDEHEQLLIQHSEEKRHLGEAESIVEELETELLHGLVDAGVPNVSEGATVSIDRRSWRPTILPHGDPEGSWDFASASSGGMKTVMNSCFAISLHAVLARHGMPIPGLLMLDTPIKNAEAKVNEGISKDFFKYLYSKIKTDLSHHQVIVVESDYYAPGDADLAREIVVHEFSPENRLIPYYKGD